VPACQVQLKEGSSSAAYNPHADLHTHSQHQPMMCSASLLHVCPAPLICNTTPAFTRCCCCPQPGSMLTQCSSCRRGPDISIGV
jgi:hypothetical protein